MDPPLRILMVEDSEDDARLLLRELCRGGYHVAFERVDTPEAMSAALDGHEWDLVLADYAMPRFSALAALALLKSRGMDLPFIIVSGSIGEETAVDAMRAGAHDYLMKENLARLLPAIARELREAGIRATRRQAEAALRESEERLRATFDQAAVGIAHVGTDGRWLRVNQRLGDIFGYQSEELLGRTFHEIVGEEESDADHEQARRLLAGEIQTSATERRCRRKDGSLVWTQLTVSAARESSGEATYFIVVVEEINERKRLEAELWQRAEALAEADRQKDQFLAMLAHELRNPLGGISNAVQLLKQLGPAEPRVTRAREIIERQVAHQARLVDDLLDVSRITKGKIVPRRERLDLLRLVRESAEDARGMIEAAGLALHVELPDEPVGVIGDATRLAQVIGNLLHNSAKFTDPGGSVTVRLSEVVEGEGPLAVLSVSDTGIGIEPEMLPRVFETFTQADRSLDRSRGGLGLGLALVKGLVELHGGDVRATSRGPGWGAELSVRLPIAAAPAVAREVANPASAPLGPSRILIVEDNLDAAESLRDLLELCDCTVEAVYTGPTGLEAARQFRPEVVLCDLGLPGMDGYQVAAALRRDPDMAGARLIAISGYGQEEDQRRAREAGFELHLIKPVDFAELRRVLGITPRRPCE
jgi:PAS domain S-box-containing protein